MVDLIDFFIVCCFTYIVRKSGRQDSNLRPPGPKPGALPSWATSRKWWPVYPRRVEPLPHPAHRFGNASSFCVTLEMTFQSTHTNRVQTVGNIANSSWGLRTHDVPDCRSNATPSNYSARELSPSEAWIIHLHISTTKNLMFKTYQLCCHPCHPPRTYAQV